MSNRRVKSLAIDEDDYDDFEDYDDDDDEDLSPEDKEQLRQGTIKVREALGSAFPSTDKEIHESLWHYYYDVGKTVTYLKSTASNTEAFIHLLTQSGQHKSPGTPAKTKKEEPTSKLSTSYCPTALPRTYQTDRGGHDGLQATISHKNADGDQEFTSSTIPSIQFSAAEFFKDCPWLRIPENRKAEILIEPLYPRLGLLGGASTGGKMSKLAALAAKRRQKEGERSESTATSSAESQDGYTARLNKLRISVDNRAKPVAGREADTPRKTGVGVRPDSEVTEQLNEQHRSEPSSDVGTVVSSDLSISVEPCIRGRPSPFASIMTSHDADIRLSASPDLLALGEIAKSFDFTEPSPDDVVRGAQNPKAATPAKAKAKEPAKAKSTGLAQGVQQLSVQETPKVKSKNIDVLAEYKKVKRKKAANFVVIGHVDAGKSTLMGRLLFDLKAVDERTMDKYRKEAERIGKGSFAFAWVLDQGTEERERGVTIDIATNKFETDKTNFTILDAPGHRDFVPNMIAGASQADFAVLVIDASTGNFESGLKGQTKEHALLVRSIGVQRIIVAVNKMDAVDWSQGRFEEISQQMSAFLTSAGFQSKNVTFVPCSGLEGGNILEKPSNPKASWYAGPTLVEELDQSEPSTYALDKPLRMTINDVFRGSMQNPLSVSGRIEAGNVQVGEHVVVMPSGERAQIRSLEVDDEPQDWAVAGQNVVINLTDIDPIHLKTGDVLCSGVSPILNVREFKAKVLAFDHITPMNIEVHKGRLHVPGRIGQLIGLLDKSTGTILKKKPKIVQPGSVVRVVVQLDQPVPLEAPSRVILRANGETVAAGLLE
ncbi:elongation factor 1-alpha [Capronia epimyces CBS 606.96]|uniref:Elongation factor 1 alpha-like protein n=1 Tax=Capronia epimyces CBS 606.96 TaxID=1182542 RepID=W9ZEM5_9EURO|nr:elongation factor 1-alpha [Capronia epimyces CBS 606.96]EXJ92949.1 elongation factor 1-alpha [Capronia epimyces CBS 606.96]